MPTNACFYVCKYVDKKRDLDAKMTIKKLAGATPEVNLRNPLYASDEACK